MQKTVDFLDRLRSEYQLDSDYQLAHKLECSKSAIYNLRSGRHFLGDMLCFKISDLLELDTNYVLACVNFERSVYRNKRDDALFWERLINKYSSCDTVAQTQYSLLFD